MIKKTAKHIHRFRLGFLLVFSVFFLAYIGFNPIDMSKYYGAKFSSAVGMSVGIKENPVNKIAAQLKEKEEALNQKEDYLNQKETELNNRPRNDKLTIWFMGGGLIFLFVLIVLNFILDKRFRKKNKIL